MRKQLFLLAAAAATACVTPALAVQTSDSFQTRINIVTSCIVTAADLDFGNVGVIVGGESATAAVIVNCSAGTPYSISFDAALPPAPSVSAYTSAMINGAEDVAYSAALSGIGGIGPGSFTITGVLPAQVTPPAALYTDNKTVYLNY